MAAGTIETVNNSTFLLQSGITGAGTLNKSGNGRLVLTGTNTYVGGTNVQAGALQLGNCGTSGSIAGDARVDGALVLSRSDAYTLDGAVSGNGAVVKDCTGTTIVNGANTYAGGTLVNAGTLQGDTRSLQGEIVNDAALVFDQAFDGTFGGTLFGAGTMTKRGSGVVSLAGNHGLQGLTTIESGTLGLNGTMAGAVNVLRDGTFDATGVVGGSLTVDGRVNVPSSASGEFGLLGVVGDATFRPESIYGVALNAAGQNSALMANGSAGVQGSTIAVTAAPGDLRARDAVRGHARRRRSLGHRLGDQFIADARAARLEERHDAVRDAAQQRGSAAAVRDHRATVRASPARSID